MCGVVLYIVACYLGCSILYWVSYVMWGVLFDVLCFILCGVYCFIWVYYFICGVLFYMGRRMVYGVHYLTL